MKLITLIFLISFSGIIYSQDNYSEGLCPLEWFTQEDTIFHENERTLAWIHKVDDFNTETRNIIKILIGHDSIGNPRYFIEELASDKNDLNNWYTNDIILGQDSINSFGIYESHLKIFTEKPSEKEVYDLLEKWGFKLLEDKWTIYESGLNIQLWLNSFGFKPNRELKVK